MTESPPPCLADAVAQESARAKVLWSGRPTPWVYARLQWLRAAFAIPFTAFAIYWTWSVYAAIAHSADPSQRFPLLWGGMFILIGVGGLLSPLYGGWLGTRTFYLVTERAAVILQRGLRLHVRAFDVSGLKDIERVTRGGAGGDLVFRREMPAGANTLQPRLVGFLGLREVDPAARAIRRAIELEGGSP